MTDRSTRRPQTTLAFHSSRIVVDIGVLVVMAAMSLPHLSTAAGDRTAVQMDTLPALLLVIPIFVITLIPDHSRPIPTALGWPALILGLAAFPFSIVKYLDTSVLADTLDGDVAIGARILVLGTFVTVVGIAIGLARSMLRLPTGGAYPTARQAATKAASAPRRSTHDTLVAPAAAKPGTGKPAAAEPPATKSAAAKPAATKQPPSAPETKPKPAPSQNKLREPQPKPAEPVVRPIEPARRRRAKPAEPAEQRPESKRRPPEPDPSPPVEQTLDLGLTDEPGD